jgi:hypothetical protein
VGRLCTGKTAVRVEGVQGLLGIQNRNTAHAHASYTDRIHRVGKAVDTVWCRSYTSHLELQRKRHGTGCFLNDSICTHRSVQGTWICISFFTKSGRRTQFISNSIPLLRMSCL